MNTFTAVPKTREANPVPPPLPVDRPRRARHRSAARSLFAQGEPLVWLTGGALVLASLMIVALLALVASLGLSTFWPGPLVEVKLHDGRVLLGEVSKQERFTLTADALLAQPTAIQQGVLEQLWAKAGGIRTELIDELTAREGRLRAEQVELGERIAQLRKLFAGSVEIQLGGVPPDDPFARSQAIRNDRQQQRQQKLRTRLSSLEQRAAALDVERQQAQHAVEFFRLQSNCDVASLLAADLPLRQAAVDALLNCIRQRDDDLVHFRRRMLRTGNYELTNEHFNWVADYQILPGGESRPQQATLIERTAWGRFYGQPLAFTERHIRRPIDHERELTELVEFWRRRITALDTGSADAARAPELLAMLERDLQQTRADASGAFVVELQRLSGAGQSLVLELSDGTLKASGELTADDSVVAGQIRIQDSDQAWQSFQQIHPQVLAWKQRADRLEEHDLGEEYARQEAIRLRVRQAELDEGVPRLAQAEAIWQAEHAIAQLDAQRVAADACVEVARRRYGAGSEILNLTQRLRDVEHNELSQQHAAQQVAFEALRAGVGVDPTAEQKVHALADANDSLIELYLETQQESAQASARIQAEIAALRDRTAKFQIQLTTAAGQSQTLAAGDVVRAFQPNHLTAAGGWRVYLSRWWEFLTAEPREANSEGGVLPAIWGTVVMTLIMSLAVVPFGVMAALYLREYAKSGPVVSVIRIAINNLAGVPSIVFGVFGLGFFCYIIGAYLDGGPRNAGLQTLPPSRWYFALGALAASALAAFMLGLIGFTGRRSARGPIRRLLGYISLFTWLVASGLLIVVLFTTPYFGGLHAANLPSPFWGKGGVLWASLTLALMTLPVVIVATEEALAAVPNSMREGSYGCGASKWQTIRRIVLPHALPGIMTGMILAMARGAGEVAPLMLVGAVKLAPELPIDSSFPFLHGNRSFMHLGFHIFDVGFQSQNSEAAKPMVFTTTLLLIVIITALNVLAVRLRSYLRKRFAGAQF